MHVGEPLLLPLEYVALPSHGVLLLADDAPAHPRAAHARAHAHTPAHAHRPHMRRTPPLPCCILLILFVLATFLFVLVTFFFVLVTFLFVPITFLLTPTLPYLSEPPSVRAPAAPLRRPAAAPPGRPAAAPPTRRPADPTSADLAKGLDGGMRALPQRIGRGPRWGRLPISSLLRGRRNAGRSVSAVGCPSSLASLH